MNKIILDTQIFSTQKFGGISRYFIELYSRISHSNTAEIIFPILYSDNLYYKESVFFDSSFQRKNWLLISLSWIFRPFLPRKLERKSRLDTIRLLKGQQFDLFIPTYYDPYFLEYIGNKPFVLTVHDMIHELYPMYFLNDAETVNNKKVLIEKATKIIAISQNTKRDLISIYPNIDPGKIEVVYLGHTKNPEHTIKVDVPDNYILFVGQRGLYKNFYFFLNAALQVLNEKPEIVILCAGGDPFTIDELNHIYSIGLKGRVLHRNFIDAELTSFYKNALCFVFPSEYEGFGIPVLEAMAAGCPTLLTNHSSFPEVAGDAAIFFELNNNIDLSRQLISLLDNAELRRKHIDQGILQAAKFTWEKTLQQTLKVYQDAIKSTTHE